MHNKSIGCGASGAYALGPDETNERTFVKTSKQELEFAAVMYKKYDGITAHYDKMCCKRLDLAVWELNFEENMIVENNEVG